MGKGMGFDFSFTLEDLLRDGFFVGRVDGFCFLDIYRSETFIGRVGLWYCYAVGGSFW